jgi:signal transduction histidine kinase
MDPTEKVRGAARAPPLAPGELLRRDAERSLLPIVLTRGWSHEVQYANDPFCRLVGRSIEGVRGERLLALFHHVSPQLDELLDRGYRIATTDSESDLEYVAGEGRVGRCTAVVCPVFDDRGRTTGLAVRLVDTTRRAAAHLRSARVAEEIKRANEALVLAGLREQELAARATRLYEQAQKATRARDDLLAIVSHDLKGPLSVILSLAALVGRSEGEDRRSSRKQLASIQRAAKRMSHLIEDLLDTSSIERGSLTVEKRPLDAAPLVSEALDALAAAAAARSLQLRSELPAGLPAVWADPARLQQVLANLLDNAIKFTPSGGSVVVRAVPGDDAVTFSVTDTGPGIPEEDLPRLFDGLWQAKRTTRLETGLGLFIVRGHRGSPRRPGLGREQAGPGQHVLLHAAQGRPGGAPERRRRGEARPPPDGDRAAGGEHRGALPGAGAPGTRAQVGPRLHARRARAGGAGGGAEAGFHEQRVA